MPMTPGLVPNIRLEGPPPPEMPEPVDMPESAASNDNGDIPEYDDSGAKIRIRHGDGTVTISLNGKPIDDEADDKPTGWFANLVDDLDDMERHRIADDLIRAIEADIQSRTEWIDDRAQGIKLLGLKLDLPGIGGSADGAPVEGMSRVRHPLLLEAVLRFQANARSEMLPTDGPVKVRNDNNDASVQNDRLGDILENDLNHYLTAVASEYYPDTDRMLLMLGFGGTAFKKVYFCPLRNRPVSETVNADDLIVNNSATDLRNAKRITHRVSMRPSTVKRLQILGVYRDIELHTPNQPNLDSTQLEKKSQQGIEPDASRPEDRDREMYECSCELDIKGFEHKLKGKESGLEIPYRVTIDVSSREILSVVRNFDEPDKDDKHALPEALQTFVKYTFVPGFGFYDIGLLHILGNTTLAVTAAWREMLDMGMFANFPGFLISKLGSRQNTNIMRVPPGGGVQVETGGQPIGNAVMPLPYNAQGMAPLGELVNSMVETGQRVGGTAEAQVGEGRQDAPVGTTLAMIEQAQKILNAVHKRMHASQAEEFQLLGRIFRDHPEAMLRHKIKGRAFCWDETTFRQALDDCNLVPQADPNTASHTQRVMKVQGLKELQAAQPSLYDPIAIDTLAIQTLGWSNPQQFFAPAAAQASPPPELLEAQAEMQAKTTTANARMIEAQAKATKVQAEISGGLGGGAPAPSGPSPEELHIKAMDAQTQAERVRVDARNNELDAVNQQKDRDADLAIEHAKLIMNQRTEAAKLVHAHEMQDKQIVADHIGATVDAAREERAQKLALKAVPKAPKGKKNDR